MAIELIISVSALLVILLLGRVGMHFGAFYEVVSTLLLFLAMMFTLRYWFLLTRWITGSVGGDGAGYAAFGAYWALFLVGCAPLILAMNHGTEESMPKDPRWLGSVVGFGFGFVSGVYPGCS